MSFCMDNNLNDYDSLKRDDILQINYKYLFYYVIDIKYVFFLLIINLYQKI